MFCFVSGSSEAAERGEDRMGCCPKREVEVSRGRQSARPAHLSCLVSTETSGEALKDFLKTTGLQENL